MDKNDLNRRDFHKLTAAAFSGLLAGLAAGCGSDETAENQQPPSPAAEETSGTAGGQLTEAEEILLAEPHVCRGLNACKGQGKGGENACAGQGACASTAAAHMCAGQNACKGQGGCGSNPGMNACKGQGGCSVPLMEHAWDTARKAFETAMKKQGKEFGAAPAPMGS